MFFSLISDSQNLKPIFIGKLKSRESHITILCKTTRLTRALDKAMDTKNIDIKKRLVKLKEAIDWDVIETVIQVFEESVGQEKVEREGVSPVFEDKNSVKTKIINHFDDQCLYSARCSPYYFRCFSYMLAIV